MRFQSLEITNLRAISHLRVDDLTSLVMIAGPNGSGKSCVLDAIRLLKSMYGGYQQDEYLQWYGEFSINRTDAASISRVLRDVNQPLTICAELRFAQEEIDYFQSYFDEIARPIVTEMVAGLRWNPRTGSFDVDPRTLSNHKPEIDRQLAAIGDQVRFALQSDFQNLQLDIFPDGEVKILENWPCQIAFQTYRPDVFGIIEYHSASRSYTRGQVDHINLNVREFVAQRSEQSLYNWQGKYQQIKSELAAAYLRNLISLQAGQTNPGDNLNETLSELFQTFFPEKSYEGVKAHSDGHIEFPVMLQDGRTHDIDDLSSGEKEILYGYLKLRNSTPRHSVILLDEPELHLNPSLLQGFTDFYHRHLGQAMDNQIWMVTHSDTLLRQSVGNSNYRVFHMHTAVSDAGEDNQATEVLLENEVDRAVVDMVGDLATYRPHAKVVILEGEGDVEAGFDVNMIRRLFPVHAKKVNLVSAGSKRRVRDLFRYLRSATEEIGINNRFFAIVDRDFDVQSSPNQEDGEFQWDAYHIENYLMEPENVRNAVQKLTGTQIFNSDAEVEEALRQCAAELIPALTARRLRTVINDSLVSQINLGGSETPNLAVRQLANSVLGTKARFDAKCQEFDEVSIQRLTDEIKEQLETAWANDEWRSQFPGRDILKRFVGNRLRSISYEPFANIILDDMANQTVQPRGMKAVLDSIIGA
jgi:predicted ATPase